MTQVSGSTKTLLDAIRDGDVPKPPLLRWNDWQRWRRASGKRPTVAKDGETTNSTQESALWKSVMLELYGTDWTLQLASQTDEDADAEAVEQPQAAQAPPPPRASSPVPTAGAGAAPATPVRLPAEVSPGSGST